MSKIYSCDFLLGNHEYAWIKFVEQGEFKDFLTKYGGLTTLEDFKIKILNPLIIKEKILIPFKNLFNHLKKYIILEEFFISHSGLTQDNFALENLDSINPEKFIFQRYEFFKTKELIDNRKIIFGHTGFYYPYYDEFKIGIDTGAAYNKRSPLTAFGIESNLLINHFNKKFKLDELNLNACPAIIRENPYREVKLRKLNQ